MSNKKSYLMIMILELSGLSVSAQEYVRKIEQHTFVTKGQWIASTSVSFSE